MSHNYKKGVKKIVKEGGIKTDEVKSDELISVAPENEVKIISVEASENKEEIIITQEITPAAPLEKVNLDIEVTKEGTNFKEAISIFVEEVKEEKDSIFAQSEVEETIPEPEKDIYYKITFIQDKKEKQYYTKKLPLITKTALTLINAFEKITFKENVLGKRMITLNCKSNLDAVVELNLTEGVLLRTSQEEPWMALNKNNVEKAFNELVLNAYRELAVVAPKPKTSGLISFD